MEEAHVVLPEETFSAFEFRQEDLPGIALINSALVDFDAKRVFRWHLSLMIDFSDLIENGMPSQQDRDLLEPFENVVDQQLKAPMELPNAVFLGRVTWNATRELIYRVYDPELADAFLQGVISSQDHPLPFDFRMDDDPGWELAAWHLNAVTPD
jgi:hypothetical protein